ncbi:hypothetical protein [Rhodoferax sp. TH121]|uniref:hypothetical protein n=1 Tax=Rhodoferax sp. TH121 TaxID=2022803 RepID=UPI00114013E7|nr:hypothetical protein [Rhodoferax sp. TH121]
MDSRNAAEADVQKTPDWGMFNLVPRRKNREIIGSLHYLQSAGFVGIFIPVQTHMNTSEIEPAKGFPAQLVPSLSRSLQNFPQVLRHTLRYVS